MNPARLLHLIVLPDTFAICRLAPAAPVPPWAMAGNIFSITRTGDELSVVCLQALVPAEVRHEGDWRCLRVAGTMAFDQVGVLAALAGPLTDAGISVFALSTFDTDYLLVKQSNFERALSALRGAGHRID